MSMCILSFYDLQKNQSEFGTEGWGMVLEKKVNRMFHGVDVVLNPLRL